MGAIRGEWYAASNEHDGYPAPPDAVRFVYATQENGERYIVAKVWSGDDGDYEGTARLVAAAPELLHQLKTATALLSEHGLFDWESDGGDSYQAMEAAIRLAEGRG
jgi:hypothetical protein